MSERATVKDVARYAGVSQGVVSRVVNPGSGPVAPQTRARVLEAIAALRYRPHSGARELKTQTTSTIGLVLADISNEFFAGLADHLVGRARDLDLGVLLTTTQEDPDLERASLEMLMDKRVAGVLAAPVGEDATHWLRLRDFGVELVFLDRTLAQVPDVDVVGMDNRRAAYDATRHLLDRGHRRVALIGGPAATSTGHERIDGYRQALDEARLPRDPALLHAVPFRGEAGVAATDALLALPDRPTAVVVGNTAVARRVVERIRERGLVVPRDLSLVVFHDLTWTSLMDPPVTVMRHDVPALAETALQRLLIRLRTPGQLAGREFRLTSQLVERGSVRCRS